MQWNVFTGIFIVSMSTVVLINKTPLKWKSLNWSEMKNMFHLRWKRGGVKIYPPDPNGCHLSAFDRMIMYN